jgi:hypothetical protein
MSTILRNVFFISRSSANIVSSDEVSRSAAAKASSDRTTATRERTRTHTASVPVDGQPTASLDLAFHQRSPPGVSPRPRGFLAHDSAQRARPQHCGEPKAPAPD